MASSHYHLASYFTSSMYTWLRVMSPASDLILFSLLDSSSSSLSPFPSSLEVQNFPRVVSFIILTSDKSCRHRIMLFNGVFLPEVAGRALASSMASVLAKLRLLIPRPGTSSTLTTRSNRAVLSRPGKSVNRLKLVSVESSPSWLFYIKWLTYA